MKRAMSPVTPFSRSFASAACPSYMPISCRVNETMSSGSRPAPMNERYQSTIGLNACPNCCIWKPDAVAAACARPAAAATLASTSLASAGKRSNAECGTSIRYPCCSLAAARTNSRRSPRRRPGRIAGLGRRSHIELTAASVTWPPLGGSSFSPQASATDASNQGGDNHRH